MSRPFEARYIAHSHPAPDRPRNVTTGRFGLAEDDEFRQLHHETANINRGVDA